MYSNEQVKNALLLLDKIKSPKRVCEILGYPKSPHALRIWQKQRSRYISSEEEEHTIPYKGRPQKVDSDEIKRCLLDGMSVELTAETLGYASSTVYYWRKLFYTEGLPIDMARKKHEKRESPSASQKEIDELKAQMYVMQMEMDILRETLNVLKKDPGVDLTAMKNCEKAVIVDALKNKYPLPLLLKGLALPRSSYYYHKKERERLNREAELSERIRSLFHENKSRYGYRRIHCLLKTEGIVVSEKIVRRLMKAMKLVVKAKRKRKYNSYQGEISPEAPNHLQRQFHAEKPNQKWLTDITEFSIPAGKVYLSPVIDCFDGMPVSWKISQSPNAELVNTMLDEAIRLLNQDEKPIIHSDRGCHYRWPGWIERVKMAGLTRSMSKKGCSPDNAACEGFFGTLKNEMFYERQWDQATISDLIEEIDTYIHWFRSTRIKMSLGGMSPLDYRRSKGYVT